MEIKVADTIKKVETWNQLSLEQFYQQTQPNKLAAFKSLFDVNILNNQLDEIAKENSDTFKQLRRIDVYYRLSLINKIEQGQLEAELNDLIRLYRYEGVVMVLSMFNSLSLNLSALELFSIYELHSTKVKEYEAMMIEYLLTQDKDNGKERSL